LPGYVTNLFIHFDPNTFIAGLDIQGTALAAYQSGAAAG
jgi:hypothetical protein